MLRGVFFGLLMAVAIAPASAQDKQNAAPKAGDSLAPKKEWKQTVGDWVVACAQSGKGEKSCAMFQTLTNVKTRQVVAVLSLGTNKDNQLTANLRTPLGVAVSDGIEVSVDSQKPISSPFSTCIASGCLAIFQVSTATLAVMQKGKKMVAAMKLVNKKPLNITFSLNGFPKAYDAFVDELKKQ